MVNGESSLNCIKNVSNEPERNTSSSSAEPCGEYEPLQEYKKEVTKGDDVTSLRRFPVETKQTWLTVPIVQGDVSPGDQFQKVNIKATGDKDGKDTKRHNQLTHG